MVNGYIYDIAENLDKVSTSSMGRYRLGPEICWLEIRSIREEDL